MFPYEFYRRCENQFKGEKWYLLLMQLFFYTGKVLKYRKDPLGFLLVLWDKKIDKIVMTLPATAKLCRKVLETWILLNQKTAPFWFFTALWDRFFSTEDRDTDHFCIKTFGDPNLLVHWRLPHEKFRQSETINFDKTVMPSYSAWNFSVPGTFSKHKMVPLRFFLALWKKNKSTESRNAVPPSSP